ncbi:hypothetical protein PIROE2DRAFT_58363 [Piromyces sp. E2]|nr:hypothetical protein PIROE2DRAFT_58363 [Piromyces sp. E2]|eukprot:OUM68085.1 hypothetical protein PIROE2DRAFT_58363 [Piromyces sp. E2]
MKVYFSLVQEDGLLKKETLTPKSIVIQNQENEFSYSYYLFKSLEEFKQYYFSIPKFCRNSYEVILDKPQKLRYDIDIKNVKSVDIQPLPLVLKFKQKLEEKLNTEVLIYLSKDIQNKKFSCHMVITKYYARNHGECFSLCYTLSKLADEALKPYIDFSVYSKTQSFRLEGSTKYGDVRYKYLYGYSDLSNRFDEGMISNTSDCVLIMPKVLINRKEILGKANGGNGRKSQYHWSNYRIS